MCACMCVCARVRVRVRVCVRARVCDVCMRALTSKASSFMRPRDVALTNPCTDPGALTTTWGWVMVRVELGVWVMVRLMIIDSEDWGYEGMSID